jgi:hypothetical protein
MKSARKSIDRSDAKGHFQGEWSAEEWKIADKVIAQGW